METRKVPTTTPAVTQAQAPLDISKDINPTLNLARIIGSPYQPDAASLYQDSGDDELLHSLAVKNKISLIFLQALKRDNKITALAAEYNREVKNYELFQETAARAAYIFNETGVEYAFYNTLKPYPEVSETNIVVLKDDEYKKAINALLQAGYPPQSPEVKEIASYEEAIEKLSLPPIPGHQPQPIGFTDPDSRMTVKLSRAIGSVYIPYLDRSKLREHLVEKEITGQVKGKTLADEYELLTMIARSSVEHSFSLDQFYTFACTTADMDEMAIFRLMTLLRENKLTRAARVFVSVALRLHKAAFGTVPPKLGFIEQKLGTEPGEVRNFERMSYEIPHTYRRMSVIKIYMEKLADPDFRRGFFRQLFNRR